MKTVLTAALVACSCAAGWSNCLAAQALPSIVNLNPTPPPHATWPLFVDTAAQQGSAGQNFADPGSARGLCWADVVGRDPADPLNADKIGGPDGVLDLVVANSNSPALPLGAVGAGVITPEISSLPIPCRVWRAEPDGTFRDVAAQMSTLHPLGFGVNYPGGSPWAVTAADYDGDGDTDLFYGCGGFNCASPNALMRNQGNGLFLNVGKTAGLLDVQATFGASWLDYDKDGDLDLFALNGSAVFGVFVGADPDPTSRLYRNNGNATFTEVGAQAGVNLKASGFTCTTADLDNDGWTDLVASCFTQYNKVFYNNQDGTFNFMAPATNPNVQLTLQDLTPAAYAQTADFGYIPPGFDQTFPVLGLRSMPVNAQDFNGDGWIDLLYTSWSSQLPGNPNGALGDSFSPAERAYLYLNRGDQDGDGHGDGEFRECATEVGFYQMGGNMGLCVADYNRDGTPDIFMGSGGPDVANQLEEDYFWVHDGADWPVDFQRNPDQPLSQAFWEVGALTGTYKNLYMTHGVIARPRADGVVDQFTGTGGPAAYNQGQPDVYFECVGLADGSNPHSLLVTLQPTLSNRASSGARVELIRDAPGGPFQTLLRERHLNANFSSCSTGPLHFGLGQGGALFASVGWPSGVRSGMLLWPASTPQALELSEPSLSLSFVARYPQTGGSSIALRAEEFAGGSTTATLVYGVLVPDGLGGQALAAAGVLAKNVTIAASSPLAFDFNLSNIPLGLYAVLLIDELTGATKASAAFWHDPAFEYPSGPLPLTLTKTERRRWDKSLWASPEQPSSARQELVVARVAAFKAESVVFAPLGKPALAERLLLTGKGSRRFPGGEHLEWEAGNVELVVENCAPALLMFQEGSPRVMLAGAAGCCDVLPLERKWLLEFEGAEVPLGVDGLLYLGKGERISH